MSERITEAELRDIEIKAPRFVGEMALDPVLELFAANCLDLVAEVRRLRGLIAEAVGVDPLVGPRCPRQDGCCWWCDADVEPPPAEPHAPDCPWPALEAEALAIAKEEGAAATGAAKAQEAPGRPGK